ncbi:MAG: MFS transporter [Eubacterium sp.]|nr:MFS transporter [Eubacterium sp.]
MSDMPRKISANTYTKKELFGYLTGMFGQNVIYQVIAAGLVSIYLGTVLYIPASVVAVILVAARIWDAINDPMMGTIVDRTHTKWGKCRPYLIIFPAIIGAMTILCFVNGIYTHPGASQALIIAWAAVSYIAWGMLFTVCDILLWGITSLMTEDMDDRAKILGLARLAAGIGGIGTVISFIPGFLKGMFEGKYNAMADAGEITQQMANNYTSRAAWIATVVIITVVATICFEVAGLATRERVPGDAEDKRGIIENFKIMWKCLPFRQILISGVLRSPLQLLMILAMPLMLYYYTDNAFENIGNLDGGQRLFKIAVIGLAVFIPQFVAMAITPALVKKYESKKVYNFYTIAGAVPYALIFVGYLLSKGNLLPWGWVILSAICIGLASASMGGINVMQSIMIADCVDYEEFHNGYRPDGVFFSGQSFLTKLSGGIAALIQGLVYTIVKFSDQNLDNINYRLAQGEHFYQIDGGKYAAAMFFLISIPIAVGMLLSALPMKNYAMTDDEHRKMVDALIKKRAGETPDADAQALMDNFDEVVDVINKIEE